MRALILFALPCFAPAALASDALLARNLQCDEEAKPRAQAICRALEREMHWVWTGHAIIAPSFRVTFESMRDVFCRLPVRPEDTTALVEMALKHWHGDIGMRNAQLQNGAFGLLYLLGPDALTHFPEPEMVAKPKPYIHDIEFIRRDIGRNINDPGMVWNRAAPFYLLREGCKN